MFATLKKLFLAVQGLKGKSDALSETMAYFKQYYE
jgi:hypothetical protein